MPTNAHMSRQVEPGGGSGEGMVAAEGGARRESVIVQSLLRTLALTDSTEERHLQHQQQLQNRHYRQHQYQHEQRQLQIQYQQQQRDSQNHRDTGSALKNANDAHKGDNPDQSHHACDHLSSLFTDAAPTDGDNDRDISSHPVARTQFARRETVLLPHDLAEQLEIEFRDLDLDAANSDEDSDEDEDQSDGTQGDVEGKQSAGRYYPKIKGKCMVKSGGGKSKYKRQWRKVMEVINEDSEENNNIVAKITAVGEGMEGNSGVGDDNGRTALRRTDSSSLSATLSTRAKQASGNLLRLQGLSSGSSASSPQLIINKAIRELELGLFNPINHDKNSTSFINFISHSFNAQQASLASVSQPQVHSQSLSSSFSLSTSERGYYFPHPQHMKHPEFYFLSKLNLPVLQVHGKLGEREHTRVSSTASSLATPLVATVPSPPSPSPSSSFSSPVSARRARRKQRAFDNKRGDRGYSGGGTSNADSCSFNLQPLFSPANAARTSTRKSSRSQSMESGGGGGSFGTQTCRERGRHANRDTRSNNATANQDTTSQMNKGDMRGSHAHDGVGVKGQKSGTVVTTTKGMQGMGSLSHTERLRVDRDLVSR